MADSELIVALVALATSLVALLIASVQLTADIFATAEGRRKTSKAVMGPFGGLTEKERRWKELRFEVTYVSPHLLLTMPKPSSYTVLFDSDQQIKKDDKLCYGKYYAFEDSKIAKYIKVPGGWHNDGWQLLLDKIHESSTRARVSVNTDNRVALYGALKRYGTKPGVVLQSKMWDLLPDDVGKTVASTELFDILVIARRLGAIWHPWRSPENGLQAEGNGHSFSSTNIRGLGIALSYQYVGVTKTTIKTSSKLTGEEMSDRITVDVWNDDANKLMFGVCPGNQDFDLRDFFIRDLEDLILIWNNYGYLDIPWQREKVNRGKAEVEEEIRWKDIFKNKRGRELRHATNDLIALICPMIRPTYEERVKAELGPCVTGRALLPCPIHPENMFQGYRIDGDLKSRRVFLRKFKAHAKQTTSKRVERMLDIAHELAGEDSAGNRFGMPHYADHSGLSKLLDRAQDGYAETTEYFNELGHKVRTESGEITDDQTVEETKSKNKEKSNEFYFHLLRAHLSRTPLIHGQAMDAVVKHKNDREKEPGQHVRRTRCEQVWLLFDNIEHFQRFMKRAGFPNGDLVEEAWIVLFFRGMCWSLCHISGERGTFLPTEYYGSQMPIYLI